MENPLVSIIVPVYNAELYLEECLNSLIGQTYKNLEILLIDDGSKDKSGVICDQYAKQDNRIKVHHKPNSGVSRTRNYGLDHCHGEWVAFVDSDDYVESDYIEQHLAYNANSFNVGGHNSFWSGVEGIKVMKVNEERHYDLKTQLELIDVTPSKLEINVIFHICSKLYNNRILKEHHIRFPENMILAEDCCLNLSYLKFCSKVTMIPYSGYYYRHAHKAPVYKMDLEKFKVHFDAIEKYSKELGSVYDYILTNVPRTLYISFFTCLKDGLVDESMTCQKIASEAEIQRNNNIITKENTFFLSSKFRLLFHIIYNHPRLGWVFINLIRLTRKIKNI